MQHARNDIRLRLAITVVALGLLGCAVGISSRQGALSPTVVQVPARPASPSVTVVAGPRLPHPKHLDLGLECTDCHEVDDATGEPGYPELETCQDCHEEMEEDDEIPTERRVATVFFTAGEKPRWIKAIRGYDADLKFAHKAHADKLACADCHGTMAGERRVGSQLFTMAQCMDCHTRRQAPNQCATCHLATRRTVAPPDHRVQWELRHGPAIRAAQARGTEPNCTYCHSSVSFCNDCHLTQLPSSHVGDWERRHGETIWRAGGPQEARCTFCHRDPNYCDACHQNRLPTSHKRMWTRRHGVMARAGDMSGTARCTFCHHEPAFCEACHREQEPRDHTALFRTRTHGMAAAIDRDRCTTCHLPDFCIRCHEYTSPRSHRGMWARRRNTHCIQCHFPIQSNPQCFVCHKRNPSHSTAPPLPSWHSPTADCRSCHNATGGGGAPPLQHVDPGIACQFCHN